MTSEHRIFEGILAQVGVVLDVEGQHRYAVLVDTEFNSSYFNGKRVAVVLLPDEEEPGQPCPRCGEPMHKVPVPVAPGDDAWIWGHDCPEYVEIDSKRHGPLAEG